MPTVAAEQEYQLVLTKMKIRLHSEMEHLLREIAEKCKVDVRRYLMSDGTWLFPDHIRKVLVDAISTELCVSGLLPNSEPNKRGLALEELLDRLNKFD